MTYVEDATCDLVVVGLGFIGLPAAVMSADVGVRTVGVDIDESLLEKIESGICPIDELQIAEVFQSALKKDTFHVSRTVPVAQAYIIAVPTPLHHRKKLADLTALIEACQSIVPALRPGALVIVESTIPPMTCREDVLPVLERSGLKVGKDIFLSHCPERLFPGNVVHELRTNDRIIGGYCEESTRRSTEVYATFVTGELLPTCDLTAEFCKLIENTYRDVNIALANELYMVAGKLGVSVNEAIELANRHPRVNLLKPGIGVGGHCIPIDPWFISEVAPAETTLIPASRRINDLMPSNIARVIREKIGQLNQPLVGVCGVAYKPDVNDQRESPAWQVIEELKRDGYQIEIFDPIVGIGDFRDLSHFAEGKDALVVLVEHARFVDELKTDREKIKSVLRHPLIIDSKELRLS